MGCNKLKNQLVKTPVFRQFSTEQCVKVLTVKRVISTGNSTTHKYAWNGNEQLYRLVLHDSQILILTNYDFKLHVHFENIFIKMPLSTSSST